MHELLTHLDRWFFCAVTYYKNDTCLKKKANIPYIENVIFRKIDFFKNFFGKKCNMCHFYNMF